MTVTDRDATTRFYGRWARLYDAVADLGPVGTLRLALVDALAPAPGDTVVDAGTGTGANLPYLADAVGPDGRLVGLDLTPGMLREARRRVERRVERAGVDAGTAGPGHDDGPGSGPGPGPGPGSGPDVSLLRGDAARPPVRDGAADAVLASFVSGMLADPDAAVRRWAAAVGPGGRLALCDLARSTARGRPLNPVFRLFVRATSPPGTRSTLGTSPAEVLDRRVVAAHRALFDVCRDVSHETRLAGFARVSAGTVVPAAGRDDGLDPVADAGSDGDSTADGARPGSSDG